MPDTPSPHSPSPASDAAGTRHQEIPAPTIPGPVAQPSRPHRLLPPGSCDSHAHVFGPASQYPYSPTREYTPPDAPRERYASLLRHLGFQRAVLVQPSVYGADNRLLADTLRLGQRGDLGISWRAVAVVEQSASDQELEALDRLGVRGVRLNLVFKGADLDFSGVERLAQRIAPLGWHLQFLIDITQFERLADRLSGLPVPCVIDHMGHFPAPLGPDIPAFRDLLALLQDGRTWVKLSGPNRISAYDTAPFTDAEVIAGALLAAAPQRLVFGTDWPHVKLPTSMPDDGMLVDELFRWLDGDTGLATRILVDNPAALYGF